MSTHEVPYKLARTQSGLNTHSTSTVSAPRDEHVISHRQQFSISRNRVITSRERTETNQEGVDVGGQSYRLQ